MLHSLPESPQDSECMAYAQSVQQSGRMLAAEALQGVATATTVRVRQGQLLLTDGPFAETKEQLADAGVLLDLNGLHPPAMGARVSFDSGKPVVTDGPFTETKEVLGGYWMLKLNSRQEAIDWACRCPASANEIIEIRQVQELEDFPPDIQKIAADFPDLQAQ
ncbi:YciI family protein [Rheinheimera sp.]|uniref:YciI family protein n=1 Tax=Rheinheimera sp. TaxID=1869214 RepID=UPI003AF7DC00